MTPEETLECFELLFGNTLKDILPDVMVPVYRLGPSAAPGVRNREWHDTDDAVPVNSSNVPIGRAFRLAHDFSLAPTTETVTATPVVNDTDNTASELDVQVLDTFITVPAGGVWLQLAGGSEGYWAVEAGFCCGPLQLVSEHAFRDPAGQPVFFPEGQHALRIWNIDSGGTNSSQSDLWSTDGGTFSAAIPAGLEFSTVKREWECVMVPQCDPVPEGLSLHAPLPCVSDPFAAAESGGGDAIVPLPSDSVPIADNEDDTAIRTGLVGASTDYARADHNHPIRRQANPGDPELVFANLTNLQTLILDRWSTEEWYAYAFRVRVSQEAGTGWGLIRVPGIGGFQVPMLYDVKAYRNPSTTPQDDNNQFGSSPRGPFMGGEVMHWSSTSAIYLGHFRRDNPLTSVYVQFIAKYIRN